MIQQLLIKYLIQNGRLGIPEIGLFQVKRVPAQIIAQGTAIKGPESVIVFTSEIVTADKHLFEFLSIETATDEVAVIGQFNTWAHDLKQKIANHQSVELPFIGTLSLDQDGSIVHTHALTDIKFSTVSLPEGVSLQEFTVTEEEDIDSSDTSWWIYAIILLLLGIAAIAYYYL